MIEKTCLICNKIFSVHPCRSQQAKFCSRKCQHIGNGIRVKGSNHPMWQGGKIEKTCLKCNKKFFVFKYRENTAQFCSVSCNHSRPGPKNNFWNGGKYINERGYVMVNSPNHPNKDSKGYVREHRLVMEKIIGRYLTKNEVIHHVNGIISDNRPENLMLFNSHSEHIKYHKLTKTLSNPTA